MKKKDEKIQKNGFVLLETIVVAVFVISIFTFIYMSVVPLLGRYEELTYEYDIDVAYKLYHIRDAMYKDSDFTNIIKNNSKIIEKDDFADQDYFESLTSYLFDGEEYQIVYIRKLKNRADSSINSLGITYGFANYIRKIADTKTDGEIQNFIFLKNENKYAYLGLAVDPSDLTNYKEPVVTDLNKHVDNSGANAPLLVDGMIPVYYSYDEGKWLKADKTNKSDFHYWYDYNDFMWANIALVKESTRENYLNSELGTEIKMSDILAFYVWIPRFEYTIKNGTYAGGTAELPGEITVNFVNRSASVKRTDATDGYTYRTASAFTFGSDELDGFWFAKFEMSSSESEGFLVSGKSVPYVLPDKRSWIGQSVASAYSTITTYMNGTNGKNIYGLSSDSLVSDAHVLKNDEWGAVAYLSQSKYGKYGNPDFSSSKKEIYVNNAINNTVTRTGSSAGEVASSSIESTEFACLSTSGGGSGTYCYKYFVEGSGTGASTSGTVYGVFDMSGGEIEIVMGAAGANNAQCGSKIYIGFAENFSGFKGPYSSAMACNDTGVEFPTDTKYYYKYFLSIKKGCGTTVFNQGACYSHAMDETLGWYGDTSEVITNSAPWYVRGGKASHTTGTGIFTITKVGDSLTYQFTTRPVIAVY